MSNGYNWVWRVTEQKLQSGFNNFEQKKSKGSSWAIFGFRDKKTGRTVYIKNSSRTQFNTLSVF
jgi:hypothetical protein